MTTSSFLKKFIFIVSCGQPFGVGAQEAECDWVQFKHENGAVASEGCFDNGLPTGVWRSYNDRGVLLSEGERQNNEPQGLWKFYDQGALRETAEFENGQKQGIQTLWSEGVLTDSVTWMAGKREGESKSFRPDGSLKMVVPFEKDVREGRATLYNDRNEPHGYRWYKNGRLLASESFNRFDEQGRKSGPWKVFHVSGRVMETGFYLEGLKHGIFQQFDARGSVIAVVEYRFGEEVVEGNSKEPVVEIQTLRRPDGTISETVTYVNGIKEGVARQFDVQGELVGGSVFEGDVLVAEGITTLEGKRNGPWKEYGSNGVLRAEGQYVDDERDGRWVFYRESGEKEQQGTYEQGLLHSEWTWWYPGGAVHREERYLRGVPVGSFLELDTAGMPLVSGSFEDGLRHGQWRIHVNDHLEEGNYVYGDKDGVWTHTYGNGKRQFEGEFVLGQPEGRHRKWHENGVLEEDGKFESGAKHKKWRSYDDTGMLLHEYIYKYGKLRRVDGSKVDKRRDGKLKDD